MVLVRKNSGDGTRLGVELHQEDRYYVRTFVEGRLHEERGFYKLKNAVNYYEKVLRRF